MKTLLLALALFCTSSDLVVAQEGGSIYAYVGAKKKPLMTRREYVLEVASRGSVPQPTNATLLLAANAAKSSIMVTYTLPSQEGTARLELTDVATGRVVFAGQIAGPAGEVALPVHDVAGTYEARLITNDDAIGTRLQP